MHRCNACVNFGFLGRTVPTNYIASGIDVFLRCAHRYVYANSATIKLYAGIFEANINIWGTSRAH